MEVIYEGNTPFQQMIRVILGKGRNNVCKEVYESKYKNKESSVKRCCGMKSGNAKKLPHLCNHRRVSFYELFHLQTKWI
uniref:Mos1 transposase HTH domain-containing protein n=1 Tax=Parascaris univalens TaxID=6257 RepID=A0A915A1V6_PARUN